ncbi:hypothetical protein DFJ74DRAFT_685696 [Hyaloraphidium curvatum]|nr:hypothetical protein DFJ74DRAFT_685696 [Hyaloraphidium curvatum]
MRRALSLAGVALALLLLVGCGAAQLSPNHAGEVVCPNNNRAARAPCSPRSTVTRCVSTKKATKTVKKTVTKVVKSTVSRTSTQSTTTTRTTTTWAFVISSTTIVVPGDQLPSLPPTITVPTVTTTTVTAPDETITVTGDSTLIVTESFTPTVSLTSSITSEVTVSCSNSIQPLRLLARWDEERYGWTGVEAGSYRLDERDYAAYDTDEEPDYDADDVSPVSPLVSPAGLPVRRQPRAPCPPCTSFVGCTRTSTKVVATTKTKSVKVTKTVSVTRTSTSRTTVTSTGSATASTSTITLYPDQPTPPVEITVTQTTSTVTSLVPGTVTTVTESNSGTTLTDTITFPPVTTTTTTTVFVHANCALSPRTTTTFFFPPAPPPPPGSSSTSRTQSTLTISKTRTTSRTRTKSRTQTKSHTPTTSFTRTQTCSIVPDPNAPSPGGGGTLFQNNTDPVTPPGVDFQAKTGGDGWDVGFTAEEQRIINIYHHQAPLKVDCHNRDSTRCAGGYPTAFANIYAPLMPYVLFDPAVPNRMWAWTQTKDGNTGNGYNSITCVDIGPVGATPVLCGNYRLSRTGFGSRPTGFGGGDWGPIGNAIIKGKFYAVGAGRGAHRPGANDGPLPQINNVNTFGLEDERNALHCFDTVAMAPCPITNGASPPGNIPVKYPAGWVSRNTLTSWTRAIDGKVFIVQQGKLANGTEWDVMTCVDPEAAGRNYECAGNWPQKIPTTARSNGKSYSDIFPYRTSGSTDAGVCIGGGVITSNNPVRAYCWDLLGAPVGSLNTVFTPGMRWWSGSGDLLGTWILFPCGSGVCCLDMKTNASCPNYPTTGFAPADELNGGETWYRTYTLRKEKPDCWWANGDAGNIWTFNPQTGTKGCGTLPSGDSTFNAIDLVNPDKCTQNLTSWDRWELRSLGPAGTTYTSFNVTFYDGNDTPIPGFTNLVQTGQPVVTVDLKSLSVAQTGNSIKVQVTFTGLTCTKDCTFTNRIYYKATDQICCP